MVNIDTLKNYLQITDSSIDAQLRAILDLTEQEYLRRTHQDKVDSAIVLAMAIERYNQFGNEGLASMNYSGISEVYKSDYSDRVTALIRSKTRMKTL